MSEEVESHERARRRGIYLLPNLFTTAGLFAGFYSIVAAMKGHYSVAALAVFIAMITDGLDGRVARLTHTESAFGAEYDSLSDMVAFGIAPALLVYNWALSSLGKPGWLAAFVYSAATALRLARFNIQLENQDKRYFQGLPSPSGAGLIAGLVWCSNEINLNSHHMAWLIAFITAATGCLMVSNVRYSSFKELDFKDHVPFFVLLIVVLLFVLISVDPPAVLFAGFAFYALSGVFMASWRLVKPKKRRVKSPDHNASPDEIDHA